jgi:hypothetical protein
VPSDKSIIAKLQSGDAKLAQLFVHVDKSTTPTAHRQVLYSLARALGGATGVGLTGGDGWTVQEYVFEEWRPTQPQRNSALPSLSNLTSKPLTVLQKKVLPYPPHLSDRSSSSSSHALSALSPLPPGVGADGSGGQRDAPPQHVHPGPPPVM